MIYIRKKDILNLLENYTNNNFSKTTLVKISTYNFSKTTLVKKVRIGFWAWQKKPHIFF